MKMVIAFVVGLLVGLAAGAFLAAHYGPEAVFGNPAVNADGVADANGVVDRASSKIGSRRFACATENGDRLNFLVDFERKAVTDLDKQATTGAEINGSYVTWFAGPPDYSYGLDTKTGALVTFNSRAHVDVPVASCRPI